MEDRRIVGIDPGGRETGVVVRSRTGVHFVEVVLRNGPEDVPPDGDYINEVVDVVVQAVAIAEQGGDGMTVWIGVERVQAPTGYARGARSGERTPINPAALIGTSMVLGGILAVYPHALLVDVGGNGSAPLRSYPRELIGGAHNDRWKHPEPKGTGVLRHARSAWDVAGAVPPLMRQVLRAQRAG